MDVVRVRNPFANTQRKLPCAPFPSPPSLLQGTRLSCPAVQCTPLTSGASIKGKRAAMSYSKHFVLGGLR